ncbi:ribonuclease J [bacterium]|nr:MAG: ribonuclease J [bacterium]
MTVLEYGNDIIIVDVGLAFPDETMPGIDYVIPDTKYLQDRKKNIRGVLITHGHLDHIGAIPYILPKLGDPPIYTMRLTAALIEKRLEEFHLKGRSQIHVLDKDDTITLGAFTIRIFRLNHNIPDCVGFSIKTPTLHVIYTTDWKFDHTPVDEKPAEFHKIAQFGGEGVDLLLSDSTNADDPGYSLSEKDLGQTINSIVKAADARIIFATFSSLISRIQQVINAAEKMDRKVVVTGRSMIETVEIAHTLGYLKIPKKTVITADAAKRLPDSKVMILTTGSQGEEAAALARIARQEHKSIRIQPGDTVVVSASPIPGNERAIAAVMNDLTRQGAHVIYQKILDIHSSGHGRQEDLKLMISLVKPKYFMPIHGEHYLLVAHGDLAQSIGMPKENIFIMDNGLILEMTKTRGRILNEKIQMGQIFVDGLGVGDIGEVVLRDRQIMAQDGMVVIIMSIDRRAGKLVNSPDIISRGFIYMKGSEELIREVRHEVRKVVETQNHQPHEPNYAYIRNQIRDQIGEFLFQRTQRRPMILPVVIEV